MAGGESDFYTILLSGAVGGIAASLAGRERTRIGNFAVGALFTGLMAHYDPQKSVVWTVTTAGVEGLAWGAADRFVPMLKHAVIGHDEPAAELEPVSGLRANRRF